MAMAIIRPAAESAATLAEQQETAAATAARDALVADARLQVEALPAPDGKLPLSGQGRSLTAEHVDVDHSLVVLSDGDVALAVQEVDDAWQIRVVELVDGEWVRRSALIRNLADLGEAMEA